MIFSASVLRYLPIMAFLLVVSLIASFAMTRLMLILLPKWGMVDQPDFQRRIHVVPIPRGGGIGVVAVFLITFILYFLFFPRAGFLKDMRILLPISILLPLGILDDKWGVKAGKKLFFQILTALFAWILGIRIDSIFGMELSPWFSCLITLFWIVSLINAFNMIDGVDGLAGGVGCVSAFCMAFIALTKGDNSLSSFLVIFIGSLLGFLHFNWHPARIFMGDTGSMFIGYLLAVAGIQLNTRMVSVVSIGVPLLACGVPVLDICLAVWRRLFNPEALQTLQKGGEEEEDFPQSHQHKTPLQRLKHLLVRLGTADRHHLHHRFLQMFNHNQRKSVRRIYLLAYVMGLIAIFCSLIPRQEELLVWTLVIGTFSVAISRLATIELWDSAESLFPRFHTARTGLILSHVVHPLFDLGVIVLAFFGVNRGGPYCPSITLLEYAMIIMVVLIISRNYRIFWNFSVSDDYFRLLEALCLGFYLSWLVALFMPQRMPGECLLAVAGISIAVILGERLFLHFVRNFIIARHNFSRLAQDHAVTATVIYGITPLARLYRDQLFSDIQRSDEERILGLIAPSRRYLNSFCYGLEVLGALDDLEHIYQKKPFQKLVVTCALKEEAASVLRKFSSAHEIQLIQISCDIHRIDE